MSGRKKPLYRKVNTKARRVRHHSGGDFRHQRNTKRERDSNATRGAMKRGVRRGLDYTPLFRFLLSKVGQDWDAVHKEAVARLDKPDPIFWMVALEPHLRCSTILVGESSYFSGLFVDEHNRLRRVDPDLGIEQMEPSCACCTHTLDGVPFTRPFAGYGGAAPQPAAKPAPSADETSS